MCEDKTPAKCPDCGVPAGQLHRPGCDVEICSECGGQMIDDECYVQSPRIPWSGVWPD